MQHFIEVEHFGREDGFNATLTRDILKSHKCKENTVKLLYLIEDTDNLDFSNEIFENIYVKDNIIFKKDIEDKEKFKNWLNI